MLPSALNCTKYLRQSVLVYNESRQQWQNESNPEYGVRREEIFDTAEWVSYSLAPSTRHCFMTNLELVVYIKHEATEFDSVGEVLPAWLQNLLGNVITINAIQTKIEDAKEDNDTVAVYYWYGRLANILLIFDPVQEDTFEEEEIPDFDMLLAPLKQSFDYPDENDEPRPEIPGNVITNAFYFARGFIDAAFQDTSPNSTICEGNLTAAYHTAFALKHDFFETQDAQVVAQNAVEFESLLATAYPITFSCYYAGAEISSTVETYAGNFGNRENMLYNTVRKLGYMYDAVYYFREHLKQNRSLIDSKREMANYWYKTGGYVGLISYIVLYTPAPAADLPPPVQLVDPPAPENSGEAALL